MSGSRSQGAADGRSESEPEGAAPSEDALRPGDRPRSVRPVVAATGAGLPLSHLTVTTRRSWCKMVPHQAKGSGSMNTLTDAALVERILDGETDSLAILYDRYADRIHTMCVHMLRNDDAAADVTAEVFLTAAERLGQLRDPEKLKPWLYAIARNEVYRRSRHRRREVPLSALGAAAGNLAADEDAFADSGADFEDLAAVDDFAVADPFGSLSNEPADSVGPGAGAQPEELAALLQDAAAGLDDRDRMVLELHLAQGLDGQDLADALGVKRDHGYQLVHRMKERLEAATSALLIARSGRSTCDGLDEVADRWDGEFNVLWRKRFARHINQCERCSSMRSRVSKAVLSGTALAVSAQSAVLAAPISARERFLSEAPARLGVPRGGRWRSDGFPPSGAGRRRWPVAAGVLGIALLVLGGGALLLDRGEVEQVVAAPPGPTSTSTTVATLPPTVPPSSTVPLLPGLEPPAEPERPVTAAARPTSSTTTPTGRRPAPPVTALAPPPVPQPAPPPAPQPAPTTTTTTTTTQPPDVKGPAVSITGPSCVPWGGSGTFTASASDPSGVNNIKISWTGAISGSKSANGKSVTVTLSFPQPATSVSFSATATDGAGNSGGGSKSVSSGPSCSS